MFRNFNNRLSRYNSYNNSFSLIGELKNSVSGKNGELSGILTYIFQHLITFFSLMKSIMIFQYLQNYW